MASSSKLSLKLLIDQTANRVVFAEAGKETIDFLFSILTLPVGTVIRLLSVQGMVGSLANLYQSVEDLNEEYLLPTLNKDVLLKPNALTSTQEVPLFLLNNSPAPKKRKLFSKFYVCNNSSSKTSDRSSFLASPSYDPYPFHKYVAVNPGTPCPGCKNCMRMEVNLLGDIWEETVVYKVGGFVKGVVTYMVLDDLVVEPLSTISILDLLKKLKVKDVDTLEQKVVDLNMDMGLRLLKTAFLSKEVLTNVFLRQEDPSVRQLSAS